MPPSSNTSIWSPTASATAGSARIDRRRAVQVVAAVVGHRDCRNTGIHSPFGVVDPHHAFEHERAAPQLAQPGDVLPGRRRRPHPLPVGGEERRPGLAPAAPGWAPAGPADAASCRTPQPAGTGDRLRRHPQHGPQIHLLRDRRGYPSPAHARTTSRWSTIKPTAPACRARSTRSRDRVAPARPVDLEEQLRVGGDRPPRSACWRTTTTPSPCRAPRPRARRPPRRPDRPPAHRSAR